MNQEKTAPSLEDELCALGKDQAILTGMRTSLADFEKKHGEQTKEFCKKHLGVSEDGSYSLLDMIARARKAK